MADSQLNVIVKLVDQASGGLKSFADKVDAAGDRIQETTGKAQNFTKVVTAVGVAVGTYALAKFADFEKTMSGVKAVLSPTADEFQALGDKVKQLGKDTVFTQWEIAKTTEDLAKNGLNAQQILGGALEASANFASAAGTSLQTAGNVMSDAMNIFGMSAEEAAKAVDKMTGVTIASKFGAEDYSLALSQGAGVAKAAGVSFDDFNASIAATSNLFASGSDAGTSFKTFVMRLVPQSKKAAVAMEEMGFSAFDSTGKMKSMADIAQNLQEGLKGMSDEQRNATLTTIFGSDSMRIAAGMAEQGAKGIEKYNTAIKGVSAADQAKTRLDNFSGSMEKLKGVIDVAATQMGEKIAKTLRPAVDGLANALENLGAWFNNLSPTMQKVVEIGGTVALVLAGIVFVVGAIGLAIAPVIAVISTLSGAFAAISAVASVVIGAIGAVIAAIGLPVIAVVALVTAAIAGLYLAWTNNFLGIHDKTKTVIDAVIWFFQNMAEKAKVIWDAMTSAISTFWNWVKTAFETFSKVILAIIIVLLDSILRLFGTNLAAVTVAVIQAWNGIKSATSAFWSVMTSAFTIGTDAVKRVTSSAWDSLKSVTSSAFDGIRVYVGNMWEGIKSMFSSGVSASSSMWSQFANGLTSTMASAWNNVKSMIANSINWIISKANSVIRGINSATGAVGLTVSEIPWVAFQRGGIVPGQAFQAGGIIGGGKNPANHDQITTALDPGELILNRAQQSNLADQIRALSERSTPKETAQTGSTTTASININFGGVTIANGQDEKGLADTIVKTLRNEFRLARLSV